MLDCIIFTHAGMAAGVFVRTPTGKLLELSTPNLVHEYSIAVAQHALTQRSKGQRLRSHGDEKLKTVTVARLLVTRFATAYAGVGAHVDSTAYVF